MTRLAQFRLFAASHNSGQTEGDSLNRFTGSLIPSDKSLDSGAAAADS